MARRRALAVEVQTYRHHKLEICDTDGDGWMVRVYPPAAGSPDIVTLKNHVPLGLPVLIEEAHALINRRLDGTTAW